MTEARTGQIKHGAIHEFLAADHRRIDGYLAAARSHPGAVAPDAYNTFRSSLLRHIGVEEKILLPAVRSLNGGTPLHVENRIRLDHGAIAALLVPPPLPQVLNALDAILRVHDEFEERVSGLYELCDAIAADQAAGIVMKMQKAPEVRLAPNVDNPNVLAATGRALERAGYNFDDYA